MKLVFPKQPCNQIQEISYVPNTMINCIGALVRQRDGDTSVVIIVDIDFCNRNNKNNKVTSNKSEHKRYCNA